MENPRLASASLQKIKSIKNPIKHFIIIFNFIKSETSDSFVNHFDGHFAYLKTLDFYFKDMREVGTGAVSDWSEMGGMRVGRPFSPQSMKVSGMLSNDWVKHLKVLI